MADIFTPNIGLIKPDVGGSDDTWGEKLNDNFDRIDLQFSGNVIATKAYVDAQDALRVLKDGDVMTGHLGLPAGPAANQATRRDYVDTKEPGIVAGTIAQYWRGDKTWQAIDKNTVGLGNVDNTSDVNKPVSSATQAALNLKANIASPAFTGNPTAPTPTAGDNDTSIATTAFVAAALSTFTPVSPSNTNPLVNGTAAPGTSALYSRGDHIHPTDTSRAPVDSPTFVGDPRSTNPPVGDNDDSIATTQFVTGMVAAAGSTTPSNVNPIMDGVAAPGVNNPYSREDHVHPTDTSRAPLASPTFTGDPKAPTPATNDNDTSIATTAYVKANVSALIGSASTGFDTLGEIENYIAANITPALGNKADIFSPTLTGDPKAPTPATADNDTSIATTAFVKAQGYATTVSLATYAPLASPIFTGNPTAPTPTAGDSDTSIATTAFVTSAVSTGDNLRVLKSGDTMTGKFYTSQSTGNFNTAGTGTGLEVQSVIGSGNSAYMAFHAVGRFATNFGLHENGNFYMGGWSHSTNYQFWTTKDFNYIPANGANYVAKTGDSMTGGLSNTATIAYFVNQITNNDASAGGHCLSTRCLNDSAWAYAHLNAAGSAWTHILYGNGSATHTGNLQVNGIATINSTIDGKGVIQSGAYVYAASNMYVNSAGATFIEFRQNGGRVGDVHWSGNGMALNVTGGHEIGLSTTGYCYMARGIQGRAGQDGAYGGNVYNFQWTGGLTGWIDASNLGNVSFTSDYRIKKDVVDLPPTWEVVKALRPIKYTQADFTPQGTALQLFKADDVERWGFLAHELQAAMIENAATGVKDDPINVQSPNPWTIIAALTKTVQELQVRVEALEAH